MLSKMFRFLVLLLAILETGSEETTTEAPTTTKGTTKPTTTTRPKGWRGIQYYNTAPPKSWLEQFFNRMNESHLPILGIEFVCDDCPTVYIPVCASNGRSFTNKCYMVCNAYENNGGENVTVDHMGACFDYGVTWDMV
ncbi:uncharacterized protein LOC125241890 isoform X2 [Leguminivora glycinivorella]|uniref:uncharacterized protein LOC125241890 isoform X2 n=1 Tax=Leguminivora glycinivorella TaxID=1035111 RepID=UPI00200C2DEC|nr:uncharacterized protein LOC125241890 isoform X2 [Leguminivora glycinivorella]